MLLKIYVENPNPKHVSRVVDALRSGGVVIYPTDTVYAIGCDLLNHKAIDRLAGLKNKKDGKTMFSIMCHSLSQISDYSRPLSNSIFKLIKKNTPGPFTFILNANSKVPDIFQSNKKTIGIRIPDNNILLEIIREFGNPLLTTSIRDEDEIVEYTTDPELIHEKYNRLVDIVIDGGYGQNIASTIVDCTTEEPFIVRQGIGELV